MKHSSACWGPGVIGYCGRKNNEPRCSSTHFLVVELFYVTLDLLYLSFIAEVLYYHPAETRFFFFLCSEGLGKGCDFLLLLIAPSWNTNPHPSAQENVDERFPDWRDCTECRSRCGFPARTPIHSTRHSAYRSRVTRRINTASVCLFVCAVPHTRKYAQKEKHRVCAVKLSKLWNRVGQS